MGSWNIQGFALIRAVLFDFVLKFMAEVVTHDEKKTILKYPARSKTEKSPFHWLESKGRNSVRRD